MENQIVEDNLRIEAGDPEAWKFYRRQHIYDDFRPSPVSKLTLPSRELDEAEKEEILNIKKITLQEAFDEDEEEACDFEVLQIQRNRTESSCSITPADTPWRPAENRVQTPDSHDSEDEIEKLWKDYLEDHARRVEEDRAKRKPDRKWQSYLRSKSKRKGQPPPPLISWQSKRNGLYNWTNASEGIQHFLSLCILVEI